MTKPALLAAAAPLPDGLEDDEVGDPVIEGEPPWVALGLPDADALTEPLPLVVGEVVTLLAAVLVPLPLLLPPPPNSTAKLLGVSVSVVVTEPIWTMQFALPPSSMAQLSMIVCTEPSSPGAASV